jgi:sugar/nucleoside kinase (ribokinase family)
MSSELSGDPILIVGSMAFDDLELPTGAARDVVGGSATYAAISASLLAPVRIVAVVGDDFPAPVLERLGGRGIDTGGVERAAGKTFRWAGRYSQNLASRTTLDTQLNVFADFRPKLPESYRASPIVLLGNIHPALQLEVLGQTRSPRFVAADTMNFWIEGERNALGEVLSRIDALVINDEELRQLAGEHNVLRAARAVRKLGPKWLIVKRGEYGAMLFDDHGTFFAPAFPLETEIDPTGAGDTFAGALLGHLAQAPKVDHEALRRALMFAAAVASFCVEDIGTRRLEQITRDDVTHRLDALHRLIAPPAR